ncbi:MAG: ROK family protein [Oscillospiraceae bacterium]|nr:ROK family protein [Oscillospiraceae bacterium]
MKLGIDVGGTKTKVAVLDRSGQLVATQSYATIIKEKPFLDFLTGLIQDHMRKWPEIRQAGIGIPGTVDAAAGLVIGCPALQVENLYLCRELRQRVRIPVCVENDVNAWAVAEGEIGACRKDKDYVLVTVGTGIGAGIVINREVYRGAHYEAGEIGYMVSEENLQLPTPSKQDFGAFEKKASAIAVSRLYQEMTGQAADTQEVFRRAKTGEKVAQQIVGHQLDALAIGLANIICILEPAKIVIGGGLANEGEYLLQNLRTRVEKLIPSRTVIALSEGGNWGGAIGAALLAGKKLSSLAADTAD